MSLLIKVEKAVDLLKTKCLMKFKQRIYSGKKYNIKEALNNKVVTMAELESNGFKPLKEEKNLQKY